jgi:1,4-alpha-glucan branching enzyme
MTLARGFMFIESNTIGDLHRYSAKRNPHHVDFVCRAPQARRVSLVGDFNDWNPRVTPMPRQSYGRWMVGSELSHGYHEYLFHVDGKPVPYPTALDKTRNRLNKVVSHLAVS